MIDHVLCVGDVMVDVLARLSRELEPGSDTPAPIALTGGGSAANTASWLATAGVATTFFGRVGDDVMGRLATEQLAHPNLELAVSVDPVRPTGTCIVLVDTAGERTMIPSAGANDGLDANLLPAGLFRPGTHVHVSAYALFGAGSRTAARAAVQLARDRGCPVSVDAASTAPLLDFGAAAFLRWLPRGLLFANRDEAAVLTDAADAAGAAQALASRCGEAIVKRGAYGAVWSDGREVVRAVPDRIAMVDSTGAGDAFAAGVLAARRRGAGPAEFLRAGNQLAARAVSAIGARPVPD